MLTVDDLFRHANLTKGKILRHCCFDGDFETGYGTASLLCEFDHLWQLSTAGAVRVRVDEESAAFSLQLVELDREPHVSHSFLPGCVPLLGLHLPLIYVLPHVESRAHGAAYEECRSLLDGVRDIKIPRLAVLVVDCKVIT